MTLTAQATVRLHEDANRFWHRHERYEIGDDQLLRLVLLQHHANFDLWHEEDEARSPGAQKTKIAEVKRAIDRLNQERNDLTEQIDTLLMTLAGVQNDAAPLHSETPGLMIDRLSILSLKLYHTAEEAHRKSATAEHRARNLLRQAVLEEQRRDLSGCLEELWAQVLRGERRFKLYRQMKMYNDPELNPVLYAGTTALKKSQGS